MDNFDFIIFDFDGTVVDTGEGILKSLQYSFLENGEKVPDLDDLKKFIGPPIHYSYTHFYNISEERVGDFIFKYRERYSEKGIYECELYSGMRELLLSLKKSGKKLGIASSKPERLIYSVGNYLEVTELFDAVVGVKVDDSSHSTKVALVEECLKKLGVENKSRAIMVGDRKFDIDGGKGAGIRSCGALWGYGSREEFIRHEADFIAEKPEDVLKIVFKEN